MALVQLSVEVVNQLNLVGTEPGRGVGHGEGGQRARE
jgi:hypothetical protein